MNGLKDKIFGCLAGSNIGSAMGAAVEGFSIEAITEKYGVLESFEPYRHYLQFAPPDSECNRGPRIGFRKEREGLRFDVVPHRGAGYLRPPGTTEDGIERQRLLCEAIAEKGGRVTVGDYAKAWLKLIDPENFCVQMEPCDEPVYRLLKAGMYPEELGRYCLYNGLVPAARSTHPIGLINAGNPEQARRDTFDVGRIFQNTYGYGLDWAACVNAAIAACFMPGATLDSVLRVAVDTLPDGNLTDRPKSELKRALAVADECEGDWKKMRCRFNDYYFGLRSSYYDLSTAHEIVSKGFAIFKATRGDTREACIAASNFGRDTDCAAAVAGGLAGALTGSRYIPGEWVKTVDEATVQNRYTVSNKTLMEHTEAIYGALFAEMEKDAARIKALEELARV